MRKTKKIGLSIRILIVALVIALGFFIFKQVSNTIRLKHSNQQALATDYNIEGDLCLEIENGPVENPCKGDLNKDGYITRADALYLFKYSANLQTGITVDNTLTDLNNDGEVTAADARIVLRLATYINDYRNYMLNEAEGIDLQDMISYVGEDYLKNCNTLFVGESIIIAPNFELSDKNSIASRTISAGSSDPDVAIIEVVDDTKVKVTAKGVGDVQIIVTSDEEPQTIGVLNLRVYGKMNIVGEETVDNYKVGDINTDGIITDYDAIELLAYTAGINSVLEEKEIELDINKDGKVTAADARSILRLSEYLDGNLETLDSSDIEIWGNNAREIYNTLYVGEEIALKAVDSDKTEFNGVKWSSSDTNILTVENGIVTALSEGTAKITVTNSDNTLVDSITFMVKGSKIDRATQLEYVDNGDGTCKIIGYTGTNAVLVIPENINQLKVVEIGDNAFKDCISLNRIEIPSCVVRAGENIFTGCLNLNTVYAGADITLEVATSMTQLMEELGIESWQESGRDIAIYIDNGTNCKIMTVMAGSPIYAIPSSICGKSVTAVGETCFTPLNAEGTVVKIPETVTTIESKAFTKAITRIVWLTEKGSQNLNIATDAFDSNAKVICLSNKGLYNKLKNDGYDVNVVGTVHTDNDQLVVGDQNSTIFGYVEPGWENEKIYDYSGANGDRTRIYSLAFANNTAIEKIDIRGWSKFTTVGDGAFINCSNLKEVYLPKNTTTIGIKTFYNCTGLSELVLPEKITSIGQYAFDGMSGVVYYPSNIKSVIEGYEGTFNNFVEVKLEDVILKSTPTKTEYKIGDTLDTTGLTLVEVYSNGERKEITSGFECTPTKLETAGLQTIIITYKEKTFSYGVFVQGINETDSTGRFEYKNNGDGTCNLSKYLGNERTLIVPDTIEELKVIGIGDEAFAGCNNLMRIDFPVTIEYIGNNMFKNCENLKTVIFPKGSLNNSFHIIQFIANVTSGTSVADADIILYSRNTDQNTCSVEGIMSYAKAIAIPKEIAGYEVTTIKSNAASVESAEPLNTIKIPETVNTIESKAFAENITRIVWLTEKGSQNLNIATDAFDSNAKVICLTNKGLYSKLKNDAYDVNIVGAVHTDNNQLVVGDQNSTIFGYVEPGWENEKIYDYSGANGDRTRIYSLAFANNTAIEKIDIRGWSKFTTVGNGAFMNCTNLKEVYLPKNITTIEERAFSNCSSLNELVLPSAITQIGQHAFDGMNGTVYYPSNIKSVIEGYKGTFNNFVEVEEPEVESIAIKENTVIKNKYFVGDTLNTEGLVIIETYNNGTTKEITSGFECTPTKFNKAGEEEITVTYKEKTTKFKVTVEEPKVESIAIKENTVIKNKYFVGDTLNTEGLVITATYNNGTTKEITSGFECTPTKLNKAGEEEITVTFEEKTTKFKVTVTEKIQSESVLKATSEYKIEQGNALYITEIMPKTYIQDFRKQIETGYETEIYEKENKITNEKEYVKTSMKMIANKNGAKVGEYILVVKGDCTGDGIVNALDLVKAIKQYKYARTDGEKGENLEGAKLKAIKFTTMEGYTPSDLIGEVKIFKEWRNK